MRGMIHAAGGGTKEREMEAHGWRDWVREKRYKLEDVTPRSTRWKEGRDINTDKGRRGEGDIVGQSVPGGQRCLSFYLLSSLPPLLPHTLQ